MPLSPMSPGAAASHALLLPPSMSDLQLIHAGAAAADALAASGLMPGLADLPHLMMPPHIPGLPGTPSSSMAAAAAAAAAADQAAAVAAATAAATVGRATANGQVKQEPKSPRPRSSRIPPPATAGGGASSQAAHGRRGGATAKHHAAAPVIQSSPFAAASAPALPPVPPLDIPDCSTSMAGAAATALPAATATPNGTRTPPRSPAPAMAPATAAVTAEETAASGAGGSAFAQAAKGPSHSLQMFPSVPSSSHLMTSPSAALEALLCMPRSALGTPAAEALPSTAMSPGSTPAMPATAANNADPNAQFTASQPPIRGGTDHFCPPSAATTHATASEPRRESSNALSMLRVGSLGLGLSADIGRLGSLGLGAGFGGPLGGYNGIPNDLMYDFPGASSLMPGGSMMHRAGSLEFIFSQFSSDTANVGLAAIASVPGPSMGGGQQGTPGSAVPGSMDNASVPASAQ